MSDGNSGTAWAPSAEQERLVAVFAAHDYDISVADACAEAEIARRTYYNWHDDPAFSAWWQFQSERHFRLELHRVHRATFQGATSRDAAGSPQAQKLFLERFDRNYCPASRQHTEISGGLGIDMLNMTPDELERYANATDDATPDATPGPGPVVSDAPDAADTAPGQVATGSE